MRIAYVLCTHIARKCVHCTYTVYVCICMYLRVSKERNYAVIILSVCISVYLSICMGVSKVRNYAVIIFVCVYVCIYVYMYGYEEREKLCRDYFCLCVCLYI